MSEHKMADSVEISFVDENDFVKEGKWYLLSENSQREISGIGISQPTPLLPLSVPLFSLASDKENAILFL